MASTHGLQQIGSGPELQPAADFQRQCRKGSIPNFGLNSKRPIPHNGCLSPGLCADRTDGLSVVQQVIQEGGELCFLPDGPVVTVRGAVALGQVCKLRREDTHSRITWHIGALQGGQRHPA